MQKEAMMKTLSTTRLSSRGQVVIPEEVRTRLRLREGARFVVVGEGDVVILKKIEMPSMSDFDDLVGEARRQARRAGLTRGDITDAIMTVRSRK
jgi:AbrB family looped-hinge helix DNA binding protein